MRVLLVFLWAIALAACSSEPPADTQPMVSGAWIRPAPPSAEVLAGYMTVSNPSQTGFAVVAASSPRFQRIEFHHMRMENGQMFMQQMQQVDVAAGSRAKLQPGADHLMMIKPTAPVTKGERIPVMLTLEDAAKQQSQLAVNFLVRD